MGRRSKYNFSEEEAICRIYLKEHSLRKVAAEFGCCYRTVKNILERHGINPRKPGRPAKKQTYKEAYAKCMECYDLQCSACSNFKAILSASGFSKACDKCGRLFNYSLSRCPVCNVELTKHLGESFILMNPSSSFASDLPPGFYHPSKVLKNPVTNSFSLFAVRVRARLERSIVSWITKGFILGECWEAKKVRTGLHSIYIPRYNGYIFFEATFGALVDIALERIPYFARRVVGTISPTELEGVVSYLQHIFPGNTVEIQSPIKGERAVVLGVSESHILVSPIKGTSNMVLKLQPENLKLVS